MTQNRLAQWASFVFPILCFAVAWELLTISGIFNTNLIPAPSELAVATFEKTILKQVLLTHLLGSFYRILVGFGLGVFLGVSLGIMMGVNELFRKTVLPVIGLLIPIPTLAWVPLLLVLFGIGEETVILAIFLGSFFPIVYNTFNGIRSVDKMQIWASQSMGADDFAIFSKILLPGSMVSVVTGLRLAIGYSWRALVGAEMLAAGISWGVGKMIFGARAFNDIQTMFVGLLTIAIAGFLMDRLIMGPVERMTIEKWGMIIKR